MKRVSFSLIGVILPLIIGQPANALPTPVPQVILGCNGLTGGNFQSEAGWGVRVISLDASKFLSDIGIEIGDVILTVTDPAGVGHVTNSPIDFCTNILSSRGGTIVLTVRDHNTNLITNLSALVP